VAKSTPKNEYAAAQAASRKASDEAVPHYCSDKEKSPRRKTKMVSQDDFFWSRDIKNLSASSLEAQR
jgi:hypothetical protein